MTKQSLAATGKRNVQLAAIIPCSGDEVWSVHDTIDAGECLQDVIPVDKVLTGLLMIISLDVDKPTVESSPKRLKPFLWGHEV